MKLLQAEAGVNDGKAGLHSAAGLFSKAGIFDKRSEAFNIKELNPYLLLDTRTSMLGELESPTLDLDPATPSTLDVITATRSGVATYTDADGLIQTAPENTVRVDHVDGVPMMLIEPSATNLVPYSEDFSEWTELSTTVTVNNSLAPDGNQTADKITADSGSALKRISSVVATTSATDYTVSFYAKAGSHQFVQTFISNSGAFYANFDLISGESQAFGGATSKMTLVANGFYRCEFTFTGAATLSAGFVNFADSLTHPRAGSSSSTGDFYIWGAQIEEGAVATSFIPTSGSTVQRSSDDLVIDGSDFSDFYNQTEGTFYAEGITRRADGVPFIVEVENGADNRIYLYHGTTTTRSNVETGGTVQADFGIGNRPAVGVLSRVALSYKTNDIKGSVDGGSVIGDTSATIPTTINNLNLGARFGQSDTFKLNGHLKRLIYWPTHSDSL